ncbi:hypothetical protein HS088_TW20G00595 [Tripterygium wilfordii]|uniref:RING-type E3 ubiquitin transferase n=1 Tax=Tripterygium wilfordii TaxID=458696 RepID=A0A7J7C7X9_TRIWF|nr:E3 ubiquitin ligase BIG BROTHER-related-like [Tripterygium wilfordii]KAF5730222.1 hypothetical protein HS088_TW20G00595 [Tripterygium wilfordii]
MANVSHHHHHTLWDTDDQNFWCPPVSDDLNSQSTTLNIDAEDVVSDLDLLDRENQVSFLMDLFHQRVEQSQVMGYPDLHQDSFPDSGFDVVGGNCEVVIDNLVLDFGLGSGIDLDVHDDCVDFEDFIGHDQYERDSDILDDGYFGDRGVSELEFGEAVSTVSVEIGNFGADNDGVAGFLSDSDSNPNDVALGIDLHSVEANHDDDIASVPLCLGSLMLDDRVEPEEEYDFGWEEVDGRVDERELLGMVLDPAEDEDDVSVTISDPEQPEDLVSVERTGVAGNLEWQVLLNAHNFEVNPEEHGHNVEPFFGDNVEYDMLFGHFAENESAPLGRPPASKYVVENLPEVVINAEDVKNNNALCAVCKDEINVGKKAKQLPCEHKYHGDCILPWLGIRNTCPVCRHELPTDDVEYERRKARRAGRVQ